MIIIICNLTTHSPSMFEKVIYIYHYTIIELFYMTRFIGKTEKLGGRWIKLFFERTYFYIAENGLLWCHNRVGLSCTRNGTKPSTAFFLTIIQDYSHNFMEKQDNTAQKLPKYSKKLRNTGQKSRKYHLCMKNENMQNINASYWKMTKNINLYKCRL